MKRLAVIRVRGSAGVRSSVEDTLKMLHLTRVNHCTFVDNRPTYQGMLQKVKDYITWGEVAGEEVELLLRHRGELGGGEKLTDEYLRENTGFKDIAEFSQAFVDFKAELEDVPGLKKALRLHPPRKGFQNIKRSHSEGGALGYRGEEIKNLIPRMR